MSSPEEFSQVDFLFVTTYHSKNQATELPGERSGHLSDKQSYWSRGTHKSSVLFYWAKGKGDLREGWICGGSTL